MAHVLPVLLAAASPLGQPAVAAPPPQILQDVNPVPVISASATPSNLVRIGRVVYFAATTSIGAELWRSDGTAQGTTLVKDIVVGTSTSSPANL